MKDTGTKDINGSHKYFIPKFFDSKETSHSQGTILQRITERTKTDQLRQTKRSQGT